MIKSQDNLNDCNEGKRKSKELIATLEKCEILEKKLNIALMALEYYRVPLYTLSPYYNIATHHLRAEQALCTIKEIKGLTKYEYEEQDPKQKIQKVIKELKQVCNDL